MYDSITVQILQAKEDLVSQLFNASLSKSETVSLQV